MQRHRAILGSGHWPRVWYRRRGMGTKEGEGSTGRDHKAEEVGSGEWTEEEEGTGNEGLYLGFYYWSVLGFQMGFSYYFFSISVSFIFL